MAEVKVELNQHSYSIHIESGSLAQVGERLKVLPVGKTVLVITDDNVAPLHANTLANSLRAAGFQLEILSVEPGEAAKSLAIADKLYTKAIKMGLDRKSTLIALGGGVVGDLTGFVAATYLRGIPFVQVPTTLLAQVDSSVGGKTAVNHPLGKNLIGAFYQPALVVIDPLVLKTLPTRELKAGLAEVIKYGFISDSSLLDYLSNHSDSILSCDPEVLASIIERCCQIKASIVGKDERETSLRMILNFGHTVGHAVEAVGGYSEFNHGEAVAIGMHAAALISQRIGLCTNEEISVLKSQIRNFGLPLTSPGYDAHKMYSYLLRDKKAEGGKINWILMSGIGQVSICKDVSEDIIMESLERIRK